LFKPRIRFGRRIPSPALIISIIALFAAIGGGYAVAAKHKDKKPDKKLINKVLKNKAPGLSVAHATTADNATSVGGAQGLKVFGTQAPGTSDQTILSAGGFTITMSCSGGDETDATLTAPSGVDSVVNSEGNSDNEGPFTDIDSGTNGPSVRLTANTRADGGSTFEGTVQGGKTISGHLDFAPADETFNSNTCVVSGFAFLS
jgi:hypothetical protein